ncbi:MAG: hypothetical protein IJZ70_06715 [Bacteroidales bacterium]|nr:hypothetical protein [Bacteroidales bacterium]MBQ8811985.1 hypothetical protein [Bacteroidales bacterium]
MNNGEYADAKVYWEALNDRKNTYGNKIAICNTCIKLQAEAKELIATERFTKAIEKYQTILNRNPSDRNARNQITRCEQLRAEYLAANQLHTYTNSTYSYTFKHPAYMSKSTSSTNENTVFWSSDFNVRINITSAVYNYSQTNTQILSKVVNSYNNATITYKVIKENWVVVSGYLADGRTFYDKSIISTRKSQYDEYVKILVSAVVTCPRNDGRSSTLVECINSNFVVNTAGPTVNIIETDDERWQRARRKDTRESYANYLTYAPSYSSHKDEAMSRRALWEAREDYSRGLYLLAKENFERGEKFMTYADKIKYEECFYKYCLKYNSSIDELNKFCNKFPAHPKMKVIKGCYVKIYCLRGWFTAAKNYVKNNEDIWYNESTEWSKYKWNKYINSYKNSTKTTKTTTSSTYKTSVGNVVGNKKRINLGYSIGIGIGMDFTIADGYKLDGAGLKLSGTVGDSYNLFNFGLDIGYSFSSDKKSVYSIIYPRWNIIADEMFLYLQPQFGFDFLQSGFICGGELGYGLEWLGTVSLGYNYNIFLHTGVWQLSYKYNWYW